ATVRVELLVVAQRRNEGAVTSRRVDEELALGRAGGTAVERELDHRRHATPCSSGAKSSGQCAIAFRTGNGAACPRPQIDVFSIARSHSSTFSRDMAAFPCWSSSERWWSARLPIRQGVHF